MSVLYKHVQNGSYGNFYDVKYPHIVEFIMKEQTPITKIWRDVKVIVNANKFDVDTNEMYHYDLGFFNKAIFYNEKQCSGELNISIKNLVDEDFFNMEEESNTLSANKLEGEWNINNFRNYVNLVDKPIFTKNWNDANYREAFPIDKMINEKNYGTAENPQYTIEYDKDWNELEHFRDKYLVVRLISTNEDENVELITNYLIDQTQVSIR